MVYSDRPREYRINDKATSEKSEYFFFPCSRAGHAADVIPITPSHGVCPPVCGGKAAEAFSGKERFLLKIRIFYLLPIAEIC